MKRSWTKGEEKRAVTLRGQGLSIAEVGRVLLRSRASVMCKLQTLGLTVSAPPKRLPGQLMKSITKYAGKLPDWEIAYQLGVSREAVTKARNRAQLSPFMVAKSHSRKRSGGRDRS